MRPLKPLALLLSVLVLAAPAGEPQTPLPYRILVTNDDGVRAPGILALAQAMRSLGEVTVVAPVEAQSGMGQAISITDPIYVEPVQLPGGIAATALTATPASCVKVALHALLDHKPDLVVSGINRGYNLGMTAYVSGTVGAAREAALQGIPAIASSLASTGDPRYEAAADVTRRVAAYVKAKGLEPGVLLNVNVPAGAADALLGIRVATQSALGGTEQFEEQKSPRGRRYFWNIYREPDSDVQGTDVWATSQGYVAVTPLRVGEFDRKTYE
ncbi:MAG: 5'/3'-nucleotidase SurE, partial [Acidobacteria bacterium]|nr:5'/3'-nucleotidase SurE [Acidobacteriota bacterium]